MTSLDETHALVALALLAANANLTGKVFDSVAPKPVPDPPWVLVYTTVSWPRDGLGTSLAGQQVTVTTTVNCHCVGLTPDAARAVAGQVAGSLLNVRPVISGRACSLIKQSDAVAPTRDDSLGFPYFDAVIIFDFTSVG